MLKLTLIPLLAITVAMTPRVTLAQNPQAPRTPQPYPQLFQRQQAQINQIEAAAQVEIEALLTPEQQNQYKRARRRRAGLIEALNAVQNLSEDQQTDIDAITREASRQILKLLPAVPRQQ